MSYRPSFAIGVFAVKMASNLALESPNGAVRDSLFGDTVIGDDEGIFAVAPTKKCNLLDRLASRPLPDTQKTILPEQIAVSARSEIAKVFGNGHAVQGPASRLSRD
jgi:hypothetical protein